MLLISTIVLRIAYKAEENQGKLYEIPVAIPYQGTFTTKSKAKPIQ
jgi:hypothetical protein